MDTSTRRRAAEWLVATCGVWLVGLGIYFILLRPTLLPEDLRYIGADTKALLAAAPGLDAWLGKVFTVMGGFMSGAGVLIAYFGWSVLPLRPRRAALALVLTGLLTCALMSAVNFVLRSDFRWLLLVPPLVWAAAVAMYVRPP